MANIKQVQQVKCGIGFDTIIIQYSTVPNRKKIQILKKLYLHNGEWFLKKYFYIIFKGKKLMQWLKFPLQSKGLGFEHFPELSFSFTNEIDENKFPKWK